jgi:RimJ/RimL family protein N-acetyltransferase
LNSRILPEMPGYKALKKQNFFRKNYSIVPIRYEDRYLIMQWRNDQMYHLRQNVLLTKEQQDFYFNTVVASLFEQDQPLQLLFSFLEDNICIGYGGLVHINWTDKNAELSFIMDTKLEKDNFQIHWINFIKLIEKVAFKEIKFNKIYTYAYDIRENLYAVIESCGFIKEGRLKKHRLHENKFIDVIIHSKINS